MVCGVVDTSNRTILEVIIFEFLERLSLCTAAVFLSTVGIFKECHPNPTHLFLNFSEFHFSLLLS